MTLTPVRGSRAGQCYRTLRPCDVTPEHGSAKKRAKKSARKKILTAQDPGREALETSMRELRALADANMKAQVQAWQTYAGKPDVAVTNGEAIHPLASRSSAATPRPPAKLHIFWACGAYYSHPSPHHNSPKTQKAPPAEGLFLDLLS